MSFVITHSEALANAAAAAATSAAPVAAADGVSALAATQFGLVGDRPTGKGPRNRGGV
jgi:hypothetical protein